MTPNRLDFVEATYSKHFVVFKVRHSLNQRMEDDFVTCIGAMFLFSFFL